MTRRLRFPIGIVALALAGCSGGGDGPIGDAASTDPTTDARATDDARSDAKAGNAPVDGSPGTGDAPLSSDTGSQPAAACMGLHQAVDLDGNRVSDCAETLVANAQFRDDVTLWGRAGPATLMFQNEDALGYPGSGSVRVANAFFDMRAGISLNGATQCVDMSTLGQAVLHAQFNVPVGQPASTRVRLRARFQSEAGCGGTALGDLESADLPATGGWFHVSVEGTVPPTARSIRIYLLAVKSLSDPPVEVWFDNILLKVQ